MSIMIIEENVDEKNSGSVLCFRILFHGSSS